MFRFWHENELNLYDSSLINIYLSGVYFYILNQGNTMVNSVQKKYGSTLVFTLMVMIIAGFLFTGYEAFMNGGASMTSVGTVDGEEISLRDYSNAYNSQVNYLSQMFGGKALSQQQIQQFRVKENTISRLVSGKILLGLAKKSGLGVSTSEIKDEIKKLEYFQTNKQFDPDKYKNLLRANQLAPADFEASIKEQLLTSDMSEVINSIPTSKNAMTSAFQLQGLGVKANLVKFNKNELRKYVAVAPEEIEAFLKEENSMAKLQGIYQKNISKYKVNETRKARHILLMTQGKKESEVKSKIESIRKEVTEQNFSELAKKYTEDPSGKSNGGVLDWFDKKAMVPEFSNTAFSMKVGEISQPVKTNFGYHIILLEGVKPAKATPIENVKTELAKEYIQGTKNTELDQLANTLSKDIEAAFMANDLIKVSSLAQKYGLAYSEDKKISIMNFKNELPGMKMSQFKEASKALKPIVLNEIENFIVFSPTSTFKDQANAQKDEQLKTQKQDFQQSFAAKLIENLKKKANVNISNRI